jgi:hypothetical protein
LVQELIPCWFNNYNLEKRSDKYIPENMKVVGRIFKDEDKIYILYTTVGDILYPYLFIYDMTGKVIDSAYLHNKDCYCGADEFMESKSYTNIDSNKGITMIDSTKVFTVDTLDQVNPRKLSSTIISIEVLKIDESGKIKRVSENKKTTEASVSLKP